MTIPKAISGLIESIELIERIERNELQAELQRAASKTMLRSEWDKLDVKSKTAHFAAGGVLRDS